MARIQQIQARRGTAAAWTSANPVLAAGEAGMETDTSRVKHGDGTSVWTALPYTGAVPDGRAKSATMTALVVPGFGGTPGTQAFPANRAYYFPYRVTTPITIDQLVVEVTTLAAAGHARAAIYAANNDWQPTGAPLVNSGVIDTSATGVKLLSITATTLQPGLYLGWFNCDANVSLRALAISAGGPQIGYYQYLGAGTNINIIFAAQTYGAAPSTPLAWDSYQGGTAMHPLFLRPSAA